MKTSIFHVIHPITNRRKRIKETPRDSASMEARGKETTVVAANKMSTAQRQSYVQRHRNGVRSHTQSHGICVVEHVSQQRATTKISIVESYVGNVTLPCVNNLKI